MFKYENSLYTHYSQLSFSVIYNNTDITDISGTSELFQVTYDVVGFCERNRDVLFKDLIELMQTSEK